MGIQLRLSGLVERPFVPLPPLLGLPNTGFVYRQIYKLIEYNHMALVSKILKLQHIFRFFECLEERKKKEKEKGRGERKEWKVSKTRTLNRLFLKVLLFKE